MPARRSSESVRQVSRPSLKCRECGKAPINGHMTIRKVKPNTICADCITKHQKKNQVPVLMNDFVNWYIGEFGSTDSAASVLRREVDELRRRLAKYEREDNT